MQSLQISFDITAKKNTEAHKNSLTHTHIYFANCKANTYTLTHLLLVSKSKKENTTQITSGCRIKDINKYFEMKKRNQKKLK